MRLAFIFIGLIAIIGGLALAQPDTQHGLVPTNPKLTDLAMRACIYPIGGWTIIDCSNSAAAQSGQLAAWSRFVVQCGDDSYIATGDASTDEADSSDGWLPAGAWLEFVTTDSIRYLSCKNKNSDSDCRYWGCQ